METVLNELSVMDMANSKEEARQRMIELLNFLKSLNNLQFNRLRLPSSNFFQTELSEGYTLNDWLVDSDVSPILRNLFNGLKVYPFFEELEEQSENQYISSTYSLDEPEHPNHQHSIEGLADAYLRNTLSVSFCSHTIWHKCKISITISEQMGKNSLVHRGTVTHGCSETCLNQEFYVWYKKRTRPPLNSHTEVDKWFSEENGFSISSKAKDDLIYWYRQNQMEKISKIELFFDEIFETPFDGSGQVEPLKNDLSGWWSRRINQEHRLVYRYENDILIVCSCRGHYESLNC